MKIINNGRRAFLVKNDSVLKGGEKIEGTEDVSINPGDTVEVTDKCGKFLSTYKEIKVLDGPAKSPKKGKPNGMDGAND